MYRWTNSNNEWDVQTIFTEHNTGHHPPSKVWSSAKMSSNRSFKLNIYIYVCVFGLRKLIIYLTILHKFILNFIATHLNHCRVGERIDTLYKHILSKIVRFKASSSEEERETKIEIVKVASKIHYVYIGHTRN